VKLWYRHPALKPSPWSVEHQRACAACGSQRGSPNRYSGIGPCFLLVLGRDPRP